MKRTVLILTVLFAAGPLWASDKDSSGSSLELRLGAVFSDRGGDRFRTTQFSVGGKVAGRLGRKGFSRRLSVGAAFDYQPVSAEDFYFEEFGGTARARQHNLLVSPRLGVDLVQSERFDLTVFGGGTLDVNWQRFELQNYLEEWNNVCRYYEGLDNVCTTDYSFVGHFGAGVRYFPISDQKFYVGLDYTRFTNRKNQLLGTVGFVF
jgi:hypothetical protein